jgi:hypothetical protein
VAEPGVQILHNCCFFFFSENGIIIKMEENIAKVLKLGIAGFFLRKGNSHKMEQNIAKVLKLGIAGFFSENGIIIKWNRI